jgi:hypothetical protein
MVAAFHSDRGVPAAAQRRERRAGYGIAMTTPYASETTARSRNLLAAVLAGLVFAFASVEAFDFMHSWHSAERGILIFERACPIYATGRNNA